MLLVKRSWVFSWIKVQIVYNMAELLERCFAPLFLLLNPLQALGRYVFSHK